MRSSKVISDFSVVYAAGAVGTSFVLHLVHFRIGYYGGSAGRHFRARPDCRSWKE